MSEDITSSFLCKKHFGENDSCNVVTSEDLLKRLILDKDLGRDSQLIIVDVRESIFYHSSHILSSLSMNCHTKTMAKRAVVAWDIYFSKHHGCPAPLEATQPNIYTQISQLSSPSIVIYSQQGNCPFCGDGSSCNYFIDALIARGNRVHFLFGGFEAFKKLHSSAFIDGFLPVKSLRFAPVSLPDLSMHYQTQTTEKKIALSNAVNHAFNFESSFPVKSSIDLLRSTVSQKSASDILLNRLAEHPAPCKPATALNTILLDDPDDVLDASISQILPYLYIGNARDAQNLDLLSRLGITHIVNVTDSVPMPFTNCANFHYLHLPAADNNAQNLRPAFESAVQFIHEARKSQGVILVHCQAGVSRSVAIVMAFIMDLWPSFGVIRALEFVQNRRPVAGPNLHFMGQLQSYHDDLHGAVH